MEKDYARIEKLVSLRREYAARVLPVEQAIEKERRTFDKEEQELMAGEWLSRRLDAGLFSLQVRFLFCAAARLLPNCSRQLTLFWRGFLLKMMERRGRLSHSLRTGMKICP
jgi:hypothetical protein